MKRKKTEQDQDHEPEKKNKGITLRLRNAKEQSLSTALEFLRQYEQDHAGPVTIEFE